jgi:steroid 5-alpha reductase family enzyme
MSGANMVDFHALSYASAWSFAAICALAVATWLVSLAKRDVGIVDSLWSMLIWSSACVGAAKLPQIGPRAVWVLVLVTLWALRLSGYITWRNWGEPEDRRYQEIRARNQPHFEWKSLYLVFGLQGVLAWIVALPLLAAQASPRAFNWVDAFGATLFAFGFVFESVGDGQLARFKSDAGNRGKVMDRGLWRYTRHPNYFGEFCVWWGFYLIALSAGGWWTIVSPLLMSVLLLKVSGVTLLEKDIAGRRPAYREYIARTSAFFPGLPKDAG